MHDLSAKIEVSPDKSIRRIALWSTPRSLSTGLMYSFGQRQDITVFDEPLFPHYGRVSGVELALGTASALDIMENDGHKVVRDIFLGPHDTGTVFIKSIANQLVGLDTDFLGHLENVILVRDPREIIHAYQKFMPKPTMVHIGIEDVHRVYQRLVEAGRMPVVLTYESLLRDPEGVLRQLCGYLDIPFEKAMLAWPTGPKPYDGPWGELWYKSLHGSTGFKRYEKKEIELPTSLKPLADACMDFYRELAQHAIQ